MTVSSIKNSFTTGEITPEVYGRTDNQKWHNSAYTMRNFYVNYRGGVNSRAGLAYVGMCKQGAPNTGGTSTGNPPRDINFQFSISQGYALEFGDQYMRIKYRGAYVTETGTTITAATNANPLVITDAAHGYNNGDWVFISGMHGMTQLNGLTWIVTSKTTNTYQLTDLFGVTVNSTAFGTYTSGGTAARIYTVVAPYAAIDLPYLKFTESANTMSLTCVNQQTGTEYAPYDLTRHAQSNWTFTQLTFVAGINPPTTVAGTTHASTTQDTYYSYVVTSYNDSTKEESIASTPVFIQNNNISIYAGSNTITWSKVGTATSYNIYKATPSYAVFPPIGASYGYMSTAFGTQAVDDNVIADFTQVPPLHNDPFARGTITAITPTNGGSGLSQSTINYQITTSTGSGFVGTPVVVSGSFVSFIIENGGKNYANTDTITILVGAKAAGNYDFSSGNPSNGDTVIFNGVTWTFVSTTPGVAQTMIGATLADTLAAFVADLALSTNLAITVASYLVDTTKIDIVYNTLGTAGNAYTIANGTYSGTPSGTHLTGGSSGSAGGAAAALTVGPQTGTYPGAVEYYQQRRAYASTQNEPDTYFMSKPGLYTNFDSSIPTTPADAITGTPWAQQINGIQFMLPMPGGLVIFTGKGAWQVNGGNSAAITPADQNATPQDFNGCSATVPPIKINYNILYVQAKGSILRDLSYNFFTNIYTGTDLTVFSSHLFTSYTISQTAYAEEPYRVVWCVRSDGALISLTYLKEQEVAGFARHDTNGLFVGVCTVTEPPVDAIYVIVKRYINGQWVYYSERMDNRFWVNVEDCFCVDAGLAYPMPTPNATLTAATATGTNNISSINVIAGGALYTAPVITAVDSAGLGTGATFTATLVGGVITAITPVLQGQYYTAGATTLVITDSTGSGAIAQPIITNNVVFTATASVFAAQNVGDVIRLGGGIATVTSYVSGTSLIANITQPITLVVQDELDNMPVPQTAGNWTITTPTTVVSGLNHLEGKTVSVLADGGVAGPLTVTNGSITLEEPASAITVGLPYICQLQTPYLDVPGLMGSTVQANRKNIYNVSVRMERSRGLTVGANQPDQAAQPNYAAIPWTNLEEIKDRSAAVDAGVAIPLYTGDKYVTTPGNWDIKGQVAIQQTYPLPANITAVIIRANQGDTPG